MEKLEDSKLYEIIGTPSLKNITSDLIKNLHIKIIDIMNLFKVRQIDKIKIFIYDNEKDFQNVTKYPYKLGPLAGAYNGYAIWVYGDLNKINKSDLYNCLIHEIVHVIYNYYVLEPNKEPKIVWLDEGLAQNLSKEKEHLKQDDNLRHFLQKHMFAEDKIIPDISYLHQHGNKFGSYIDSETNKYNGYAWSYLMVRYLIETKTKEEFNDIIRHTSNIKKLEETLTEDTITYFKKRLEVDNYDQMDGRTKGRNI